MKVRLTWIIFVKIRATIKLLKKHFEQKKSKKHTFLRKNRIFKYFFYYFFI